MIKSPFPGHKKQTSNGKKLNIIKDNRKQISSRTLYNYHVHKQVIKLHLLNDIADTQIEI